MLTGLFMLWTLFYIWHRGFRAYEADFRYTWREKFDSIPKVAPFLVIVDRRDVRALRRRRDAVGSGGRRRRAVRRAGDRHLPDVEPAAWWQILRSTTRESVMILMIIATAVLFGYMLTVALHHPDAGAGHRRRAASIAGC